MKSKADKQKELTASLNKIASSVTLVFCDFSGVPTKKIYLLKKKLKEFDSDYRVVKKRLLRVAFTAKGIAFNPEDFSAQLGVVFSPRPLVDVASIIFAFSKENENFKVLGGFDLSGQAVLESDYIKRISALPSREVLLGQLVGMLAAPLKMFMLVLNERAKQVS